MPQLVKHEHFAPNRIGPHVPPVGVNENFTENADWRKPNVAFADTPQRGVVAVEPPKRDRDVTYAFTIVTFELKYMWKEFRMDANTRAGVVERATTDEDKNGK